ncbi:hypothetical protein ARMSODRAFT_1078248 [Armillaria solidipes]|uniref:Protein kinase domain-containing protein n=1 Tax=Armillaria solidipes TaxID=1076256 RepID=A0A2H3C6Q5_9AGAR|nr:hypothetical protein ARMSODRAFT_1078248 [Armillaria solidipes]
MDHDIGVSMSIQSPDSDDPSVDNTDNFEHGVDRATYDPYIAADLRDRIFVFPQVFLTKILRLPPDWRTVYQTEMKMVRSSKAFRSLLKEYSDTCDSTQDEKMLCHPFNQAWNAGTRALCEKKDKNDKAPPRLGLYRQDSQEVLAGKAALSSDSLRLFLFEGSGNSLRSIKDNGLSNNLTWVQTLHWFEFKLYPRLLDQGAGCQYRILSEDGIDPAAPATPDSSSDPHNGVPFWTSAAQKRPSTDSARTGSSSKYARVASTPDVSAARAKFQKEVEEKQSIAMEQAAADSNERKKVSLQCARYALEMLSSAGFRTHCISALIASKQMQPLYYDRSSIIVCKDFHIVDRNGDVTDFFIGTIIGFSKLTERQRGIQRSLCDDSSMVEKYQTYTTRCRDDPKTVFQGVKLNLTVSEGETKVVLTLGRIVSRQPGIVGWDTCVVEATASEYEPWKEKELVVKISWPASTHISEVEFVTKARKMAREMPQSLIDECQSDWALDHLPDIVHSQDFGYDADSPQATLRELFLMAKWANDQTFLHEDRVCRVIVQERLHRLEELKTPREYAQVLVDIAQIHKWVYDHPRILHRDISMGNIMWRRNRLGIICGVLNDFDLSSYRDDLGATSRHRTGTPPYMSFELLKNDKEGRPPQHLYRHDLESILCVVVLLTWCHQLDGTFPERESQLVRVACPKLDGWVHLPCDRLQSEKELFFTTSDPNIEPTTTFKGFKPWLKRLYNMFRTGFRVQSDFFDQLRDVAAEAPAPPPVDPFLPIAIEYTPPQAPAPFDHHTLAGNVDYLKFLGACCSFGGESLRLRNYQLVLDEET